MGDGDGVLDKILAELPKEETTTEKTPTFVARLNKQRETVETLEKRENREIIEMRRLWSHWILFFIGLIIVFDIVLVSFYGLGIWTFSNTNIVIAVITENFLKIVGLGFLITQKLFDKIFHSTP